MSTKAEEAHKDGVASMGCLRCLELGYEDTPADLFYTSRTQ